MKRRGRGRAITVKGGGRFEAEDALEDVGEAVCFHVGGRRVAGTRVFDEEAVAGDGKRWRNELGGVARERRRMIVLPCGLVLSGENDTDSEAR